MSSPTSVVAAAVLDVIRHPPIAANRFSLSAAADAIASVLTSGVDSAAFQRGFVRSLVDYLWFFSKLLSLSAALVSPPSRETRSGLLLLTVRHITAGLAFSTSTLAAASSAYLSSTIIAACFFSSLEGNSSRIG